MDRAALSNRNRKDSEESNTVEELTEARVEALEPREQRYETRLGDDFSVCTWPNGVKTWMFVYETKGFRRTRTLGTWPEMSYNDARDALVAARKLQRAEEELEARGLGAAVVRAGTPAVAPATPGEGAAARAPHPPLLVRAARTLATAAAGAVLAIGGMFAYGTLSTRTPPVRAPVAATPPPAPPSTAGPTRARDTTAAPAAGERAERAPAPDQRPAADVAGASSDETLAGTVDGAPAGAAAEPPVTRPPPDERILRLNESLAGTVARTMLVEEVVDGEPTGELPALIELAPESSRQVHFFTEVRGLQDRTMEHRWWHNERLIQSVELKTGEGWRYPLVSSFTLNGRTSAGRWTVELCDSDGELLEDLVFLVERDTAY